MRSYFGTDIRDIVAEPQWQRLRQELVGTWSTSSDGNVALLRRYLADHDWDEWAVVRVLNYLTGTAFRVGAITSPAIESLRDAVRVAHKHNREARGNNG